jgi:beta-lactamase class A
MLTTLRTMLEQLLRDADGTFAASIYHFESDETFDYRADEPFYAASIIKVPIMAAIYDQAFKGNLRLSETLPVLAEDMVGGSGILQNLTPGLELSIYDLTMLMIIESDNTATNILIDRIGTKTIQESMREWGMTGSSFHNKLCIIPANLEHYNLITARDMTNLMKKIGLGQLISWHACNEMVKIMKQQKYNDGIPALLPIATNAPVGAMPAFEMAHKTGWVNGIEHDVGLLYFPGHTFAISVLSKEIRDRAEAKRVMSQIGLMLYNLIFQTN